MNKLSRRTIPLLALAGSALCASPALASSVEVVQGDNRMEALYSAAPGEKNDVTVINLSDYALRFRDPGATITAGPGCKSVDTHTADCEIASQTAYLYTGRVLAGDGDDTVTSSPEPAPGIAGTLTFPQIAADGGPGNDTLTGGAKGDDLNGGGGGRDTLTGNGNNDSLADGDRTGVDVDADTIDGGEERDTVSYEGRSAGVTVDLSDGAPEGEAGEGDVVRDVEHATGGSAADRLFGNGGDNWLIGGAGDDFVKGGAGDDQLEGGDGVDHVLGEAGRDGLRGDADRDLLYGGSGPDGLVGGGGDDDVFCGSSSDVVIDPTRIDAVARGCESVSFDYGYRGSTTVSASAYPVKAKRGVLTYLVGCPFPEEMDGECDVAYGKLKLRDPRGRLLGSGTLTKAAGRRSAAAEKPARVQVRLTRFGRRVLARQRNTYAVVSLSGHALPNARWTVLLARVR